MNKEQRQLFINFEAGGNVKSDEIDGIEHIVFPVIAAKEMVMNDLFYPSEELSQFPEAWNGVPIPVNHPVVNGHHVSANSPNIESKRNIGKFFNSKFEDKKLKGEFWINKEKAIALGFKNLVERIENKESIEVSTGLFSNVEIKSGVFNGENYSGIVRDIRPDHIAILPNEIGACSLKDGCGTMKTNSCPCNGNTNENCQCDKEVVKTNKLKSLVSNIKELVDSIVLPSVNIDDKNNLGVDGMTEEREKLIDSVIANDSNSFGPNDKEVLSGICGDVLQKMLKNDNDDNEVDSVDAESKKDDAGEQVATNSEKEISEDEVVVNKSEMEEFREYQEFRANERKEIVEFLKSNTKISESDLNGMKLNTLKSIKEGIKPVANFEGSQPKANESEKTYESANYAEYFKNK